MNILILTYYYQPDLCAGSFRTTNFVKQLKKLYGKDCHIDIITTLPNRYATYSAEAKESESSDGITIRRVALPAHKSGLVDQSLGFFHYAWHVKKYIKGKDYSLVFATSSRLMTAALGAHVARIKKAKLYLDIRDIFVDTINDVFSAPLRVVVKPLFSLLEKVTFRRADAINLVSKGFYDYFIARYPHKTYHWYSNGIDEEFITTRKSFKTEVNPSKPYKIVYAGNIGEGQGLHRIIPELAKRLDGEAEFIIYGDGGRKQQLQSTISELRNVTLHPPVSRQQLLDVYHGADVLFLHLNDYPAFRKVLPSKIFEYAAMGKPILAGVDGFSADFIKREVPNAAVFKPCDAEKGQLAFSSLSIADTPREQFIHDFARNTIMQSMANDVMSVALAHCE